MREKGEGNHDWHRRVELKIAVTSWRRRPTYNTLKKTLELEFVK
jgi:hypothetical protein